MIEEQQRLLRIELPGEVKMGIVKSLIAEVLPVFAAFKQVPRPDKKSKSRNLRMDNISGVCPEFPKRDESRRQRDSEERVRD